MFGRRRKRKQDDFNAEVEAHIALEADRLKEQGLSDEEARMAARRAFGNVTQAQERFYESGRWVWWDQLRQDIRYGLRQLRRNPGFTAIAVITLALGIAANTTIFSAVSAILLREPPVNDPDRLCAVSSKNLIQGYDLQPVSVPDFESWKTQNNVFADMAAAETGRSLTLTGKNEPESVDGDRVTPDYFKVIGIMPALGRTFLPSEGQAGNDHVVILSSDLWHARYGSNPNVIGEIIKIDFVPYTIIGVMPTRAAMPMPWNPPQLWTPLVFSAKDLSPAARGNHDLDMVLGRLEPGATLKQAQAEISSIALRLAETYPRTNKSWGATVLTLQEYLIRKPRVRTALIILTTMVGFVLLTACANIAGLLLARGAARAHELAVRSAIGACRLRLIRQLLIESLLIGISGGGAGLLMSVWGIDLLRAGFNFNPVGRQMAAGFHLDHKTLLFTVAVSLLTTILFGLAPAVRASKVNPGDALTEGGRTGSSGFARSRLRSVLVITEISLALVLLAGAGIMARFVKQELSEKTGFNLEHLMVAAINLKSRQYQTPAAQATFFEQAAEKLRALPGVESAAVTTGVPLEGYWHTSFSIVGQPPLPESKRPKAQDFVVGPAYFRTLQIPLIKGREFSASDNAHAPVVAIVSVEFARRFFPKGDAIGQQIELNDKQHLRAQIVGIVGNVLPFYGRFGPVPQIYECYLQTPRPRMGIVSRSRVAASALAPMLRRAVWSVDKDQPVQRIQTMKEISANTEGGDKLMVGLMGIFAVLALILAAVGIYGVIAYTVNQRTREIGIRIALGAQKKDVLRMVLRQGGLLAAIGCAIGLLLALPLPRVFAGLFIGFPLQGPAVALGVALIVAAVSLLATCIPARRAARVDPMVALRYE